MDLFKDRAARVMRIGRTGAAFDDDGYIFEIKLDGERCLAYVEDGAVDLINARGNRINAKMPELARLDERVKGRCILDGELVVVRDGRPDFEQLKRRALATNPQRIALLQRQAPVSYVVFDTLYHNGRDVTGEPLLRRKELLADCVREDETVSLSRTIDGQGKALYQSALEHGLEGIVGKKAGSVYQMGRRSRDWVKCKATMDDEYVVCGYICGEGQVVASLVLGQYDATGALVYKGHATLALSGEDFGRIAALQQARRHPFATAPPPGNEAAQWVKPELVCTVQFTERSTGGLMRHPVYKGLRPDKAPAEVLEPGLQAAR